MYSDVSSCVDGTSNSICLTNPSAHHLIQDASFIWKRKRDSAEWNLYLSRLSAPSMFLSLITSVFHVP
eukprot:m.93950 g.93950  ORF g.93950 m.93950 type:complete len:68 (-) comp13422_c0_seq1:1461-1664(-)